MCSLGFKSYLGLHNRSQSVRVGSVSSNSFTLTTGVPQGSVLGNVLFFSLHFTYQYPHCYSQFAAPAVCGWHSIVHRFIPHRLCAFSHQARILSHWSLPLAFTQRPLFESYKIGCCSVWYSRKSPRISIHPSISQAVLYISLIQSLH